MHGLPDIPAGDHFVQAIPKYLYRVSSSGRTYGLAAHGPVGRGSTSTPGNLYSEVQKVYPDRSGRIQLQAEFDESDSAGRGAARHKFEEMIKDLHDPECQCEVADGSPMKGHSWQPVTTANLVRRMAEQVKKGTKKTSSSGITEGRPRLSCGFVSRWSHSRAAGVPSGRVTCGEGLQRSFFHDIWYFFLPGNLPGLTSRSWVGLNFFHHSGSIVPHEVFWRRGIGNPRIRCTPWRWLIF